MSGTVETVGSAASLVAVGAVFGGMVFFAGVFAPLVFIKLEAATAGRFIRDVFPVYYVSMGVASTLAAVALAWSAAHGVWDVAVLATVAVAFWVARTVLMPAVNAARDAQLAGDAGAGKRFDRLHRTSVAVNAVQLVAVLVVLVRFVWR